MMRWNRLRERLAEASAAKAHVEIVGICDEVLSFAAAHPAIGVVEWMFHKRAAKGLAALGRMPEAMARIEDAIAECKRYRATAKLSKPDDFLRDVGTLERLRDRWQGQKTVGR